ncbi:MAG TPA: hypothetical protein VFY39_08890 [Gammaproteobacteria bacterium]|nr:hypothetical protein [Gammaproteobacteria bacterium]
MRKRHIAASILAGCFAVAACSAASADDNPAAAAQPSAEPGAKADFGSWTVPRTPWGDPDLRGKWPLEMGRTPMQRPTKYGNQAHLTDAEYEAAFGRAEKLSEAYARENSENKIGQGHWFEAGEPLHQTSLIVAPANGRVPPMTQEGQRRAANMKSSWSEKVFDDLSDFNSLDRCITRGLPASMIPFPYNNGLEIYQSPGYVVIRLELIHETRVIPLDAHPAPPSEIKQWLGVSRGHWEGNTLVIETTNFNGESPMVIVGPSNDPVPTSTSLKITERLTPTGPNTIEYDAVVEDPVVLTAPFEMRFPWTRDSSYQMFEYACNEDNTVVQNYIRATSPRFAAFRKEQNQRDAEAKLAAPDEQTAPAERAD